MFLVVSVSHFVYRESNVTVTHYAFEINIQDPPLFREPPGSAPPPQKMFKLVHREVLQLGSGRLVSY